jgi:hypothetical protein
MTWQEIEKIVKDLINNDSNDIKKMYSESIDEQTNATYYSFDGLLDEVLEAIEESGHLDNEYSEYSTLKKDELINIYHQVKI